jgi:hypothetical protein
MELIKMQNDNIFSLYDGDKKINFQTARFTPAVLDKILPLFNVIIDLSTPTDIVNQLEGMTAESSSQTTDLKKLATLAREQQKTIQPEQMNKINICRVKILQAVVNRTKSAFDYTLFDGDYSNEFWQNQDFNEVGEIVDSFRVRYKINIYG